jgi:hypothetical protein
MLGVLDNIVLAPLLAEEMANDRNSECQAVRVVPNLRWKRTRRRH